MKSIKEKAEEKYPIITGELQTYNKKFVEGATYVLKCIEELIPNDEVLQNNVRCQSAIFRIQAIIEQLKK